MEMILCVWLEDETKVAVGEWYCGGREKAMSLKPSLKTVKIPRI